MQETQYLWRKRQMQPKHSHGRMAFIGGVNEDKKLHTQKNLQKTTHKHLWKNLFRIKSTEHKNCVDYVCASRQHGGTVDTESDMWEVKNWHTQVASGTQPTQPGDIYDTFRISWWREW